MHIATKIFVVLAAVLSIGLAALTVMYAVNAETIRSEYASARLAAQSAETALTAQQSQHARVEEALRGELQQQRDRVADLSGRTEELNARLGELRIEKVKAEQTAQTSRSEVTQFGEATQTQADLITLLQQEVTRRREAEVRAREQRLDLEDALADLQSQNQVLTLETRSLQEQLVAAREELAEVRQRGTAIAQGDGSDGPVRLARAVPGRVTGVGTDDATGNRLVEIDVGSSDGLRENVQLTVFRGGQFIATIVLQRVDLQSSVGRVTQRSSEAGLEIRAGDSVITQPGG